MGAARGAARETVMKRSSRLCPLPPSVFSSLEWGGGEASELELTLTGRKRRPKDVTSVSKHSRTIPCRCHC